MKKLSLILMSIFALGLITSCSSSNDENVTTGPDLVTGTKTLTLNIVGAQPMQGRSIGTVSADEGHPLQVGGNEATINNLIVVVYDNTSGHFEPANKFVNPSALGGTITEKVYFKSTNPSIFVLANVPLNTVDAIVGDSHTLADFQALTASLDVTSITGDATGTSQVPTNLPMIGSSTTLTANGTENVGATTIQKYTANVTLYRMVSRVALTSFETKFTTTGESFTITDVFIKNAKNTSTFAGVDITSEVGKATMNGTPGLSNVEYDGMAVSNTAVGVTPNSVLPYLGSTYSPSPTFGADGLINEPPYFYVFPNNSATFDKKTQLVIKGKYKANATASEEDRYYVCVVNAVPDGTKVTYTAPTGGSLPTDAGSGTIAANRKYSLKVTVVGAPQMPNDVAQDVDPTPQGTNNVELTITVAEWGADIIQNVNF